MIIKQLIDEDLTNYKVPSMTIAFPYCTFKCGKEYCQNSSLAQSPNIDVSIPSIIKRYFNNPITSAVTCQGLEPFDSYTDLLSFIKQFRQQCDDDIVIYTGYYKNEISDKVIELQQYPNIIIKFGRFIPNQTKHHDDILDVDLISNNQYAERIS
jgi:hypothetical protein